MLTVRNLAVNGIAPFDLEAGECVALTGASGSGKTLALRALAGESRESIPAPNLDTAGIGVFLAVYAGTRRLSDSRHRLRLDRLRPVA